MTLRKALLAVALLAVVAAPAAAVDDTIYAGIDLWKTLGNGRTHASFAADPIPGDFFCSGGTPFTGNIVFKGVPVVTGRPGALGGTDTIVHRLDDAVFDRNGVATTRIQVRALEFVGVRTVKTSCGNYKARVTLAGDQPITEMRIIRDSPFGGRFLAHIGVNVKITFTPVGRRGFREPVELLHTLNFAPNPKAVWAGKPGKRALQQEGFVLVDTDGNGATDTFLPGTSNFAAGWGTVRNGKALATNQTIERERIEHCADITCSKAHETIATEVNTSVN